MKLSLTTLLVFSAVILIVLFVSIAIVPVSFLWRSSIEDLSNVATETTALQLSYYRRLVIDKAVRNITEKLEKPAQ